MQAYLLSLVKLLHVLLPSEVPAQAKLHLLMSNSFKRAVMYFAQDFIHLRARIHAEYKGFCAVVAFANVAVPWSQFIVLLASATCVHMVTPPVSSPFHIPGSGRTKGK